MLSNSITLDQLAAPVENDTVEQYLQPADSVLQHYPALMLDTATTERVLHGNAFPYARDDSETTAELARVYDADGRFVAIAEWDAERGMWQPTKVFAGL